MEKGKGNQIIFFAQRMAHFGVTTNLSWLDPPLEDWDCVSSSPNLMGLIISEIQLSILITEQLSH